MTIHDVPNLRLLNQRIAVDNKQTALAVVQHMGAMQGQDYAGSLWALGLRTGQTQQEVITSIEKYEIVRTWPQRGTLHFVPGEDAKWLVGLSAERLLKGAVNRRANLGLDDATLQKSQTALQKALAGGKRLSRPKVMAVLEDAGISTTSGRGYHILWYLSQSGVTFIGPMEGKQQTVVLLDDAVPKPKTLTRAQGIAELTKRYFTSHGPATIQDFMWWSGLTTVDAKAGLKANASLFLSEKIDNKEYWMSKDLPNQKGKLNSFLLPGFDEYMLGYKDRGAALHADYTAQILPGGNGMFLSTIVVNGQVVGTWKRTIKKDHVVISLSPFRKLTASEMKSLQQPVDQYGRFLGLPANLA